MKDDTIRAGFEASVLGENAMSFIDDATLASYQGNIENTDYYKIIVVDKKAFTVDRISMNGNDLSTSRVLEIIRSDAPRDEVVESIRTAQSLPDTPEVRKYIMVRLQEASINTDADMRATLFAQLIAAEVQQDPLSLTRSTAEGTITFYPETITFKVIKILPRGITEALLQKLK